MWINDGLMAEIFFCDGMGLKGVVVVEHHRRTYLNEDTSKERIENRERQRLQIGGVGRGVIPMNCGAEQ